jgi:hypothetical protein
MTTHPVGDLGPKLQRGHSQLQVKRVICYSIVLGKPS